MSPFQMFFISFAIKLKQYSIWQDPIFMGYAKGTYQLEYYVIRNGYHIVS